MSYKDISNFIKHAACCKKFIKAASRSGGYISTVGIQVVLFAAFLAFLTLIYPSSATASGIATLYTNEYTYNNGNGNSNGAKGYNSNGNGNGMSVPYPVVIKSIAILPLENLSENKFAADIIREDIKKEFKSKGLVYIADDSSVERFLAKRRIRYTGAMKRVSVREMGKVMGVDAVLVGSANYFSAIGERVIVGISLRILSTLDGSIMWADNLTYTGHDFEGLLGLGIIRSTDILAALVVKDLVKGIEDRFFIRESAFSPFEIERVITYPTIGSAKDKREIRVEFLPLADEPEKVLVIIGGEEVVLERVRDNSYRADIYAPEKEGTYIVDVIAMNQSDTPFPFSAVAKIIVDNTPPKVSLNVDKRLFSYAKKGGYVMFEAKLLSYEEIDEWKVQIIDSEGNTVRSDKGFGGIPQKMIWRGETDNNNTYVKDGVYTLKLIVMDTAGNETEVSDEIVVKSRPPEISINVDVVDRKVIFSFEYDKSEPIDNWLVAIKDREGNTIKIAKGDNNLIPEVFEYEIVDEFDLRELVFNILVEDKAGNIFKMRKTIPSLFSRKIPLADLMGKDRVWQDF